MPDDDHVLVVLRDTAGNACRVRLTEWREQVEVVENHEMQLWSAKVSRKFKSVAANQGSRVSLSDESVSTAAPSVFKEIPWSPTA